MLGLNDSGLLEFGHVTKMKPTKEELDRAREDWMDAEEATTDAEIEYDNANEWWNKMRLKRDKERENYLKIKKEYDQQGV